MKNLGKVLVIEDDQDWQETLRRYLEDEGFFVVVVQDLKSGLEKIQNEQFHFVTIDLQLDEDTSDPYKFEGWQILREIIRAGQNQRLATMIITGFPKNYSELKDILELRGTYFMEKFPFDKKAFKETVKWAVDNMNTRFYDDHRDS